MATHEIRIGNKRIFALSKGLDHPGDRLFVEIMGPNHGVYGGAFLEKDDARLIARLLNEWAETDQCTAS